MLENFNKKAIYYIQFFEWKNLYFWYAHIASKNKDKSNTKKISAFKHYMLYYFFFIYFNNPFLFNFKVSYMQNFDVSNPIQSVFNEYTILGNNKSE